MRLSVGHWFRQWHKSIWLFPSLLLIGALTLSAFGISGSSVGMYNEALGADKTDAHRIFGHPESIRSDEWLVQTALTVGQAEAGFPRINPNIGLGEDVSVIFDVPYKDWSTLFRPQNWAYFVLPLEVAFALKWWLMGAAAAIGLYFIILRFLPRRRLLASLLAVSFVWAPFIQWWYQSITLMPVVFGSFILLVLLKLREARSIAATVWQTALLAYLMVSFALVLYPPFQIMVAEVMAVLYLIVILENRAKAGETRLFARQLIPVAIAGMAAGLIVVAFIKTRADVISAITHTVYPGQRVVVSGGYMVSHLLSGFLSFRLELRHAAAHFFTNQSEGSTFIFLWPFLLPAAAWAGVLRWKRDRRLDWGLVLIYGLIGFLLTHLFLSLPPSVTKMLGFGGILQSRVLLGLGLAGLFALVFTIRALDRHAAPKWLAWVLGVITIACQVAAGLAIAQANPGYIPQTVEIYIAAAAVGVIIWAFAARHSILGASLLVVLSLGSIFYIHPLYQGLSPLTRTPLTEAMKAESAASPGAWAILDNVVLINYAVSTGLPSYSGVYGYPQLKIWRAIDPSVEAEEAYNRYGFAFFTAEPQTSPIMPRGGDSFNVSYNPCNPAFATITHVLTATPINSPCLQLSRTVEYPAMTLYLYRTH